LAARLPRDRADKKGILMWRRPIALIVVVAISSLLPLPAFGTSAWTQQTVEFRVDCRFSEELRYNVPLPE